ncbi:hypothetical protein M9H77_06429 [Catharanthus roseus]|uniref:Uncharacterized protein n=1 Tax=Catharanthus roseus TaxID=4058 RepID=A0ACC0BS82_CATRO|nr:hypothetical protein M9H77_06429 [Catharanthus roseus]
MAYKLCTSFLLFTITVPFMLHIDAVKTNYTDQQALISFKNLITNANTTILATNWTTSSSFCNWFGVTCNSRTSRISALNLSNMSLQGLIAPSIENLSFLVELNLGNNNFYGSLPAGLGRLPRLRLIDVHSNRLEGRVPVSLFRNQKLEMISLGYNRFSGDIWTDSWSLPELRILNLTKNSLTGTIHSSIGNMSHLSELDLSNNRFTGKVPESLFNISSLYAAYLNNNSLSGSLVLNQGNNGFLGLELLDLSGNQLFGEIPSSLCQFQNLRSLYLSRNNFTGGIPRNFGCLANLERFYVTGNQISGTIPPSLGNISTLKFLGCVDNHIGGSIPKELEKLSNLQMLGFDYNNLTGEIPHGIFNISSLVYIAFTDNSLEGRVPAKTGFRLPNLEGLFLADNLLEGEIPLSILNASKLIELELSYNFFTGIMPNNLGFLRELQWLNLAGNQLRNEPGKRELEFMNSLVECRMLQFIVLGNNPLSGSLPNSVGNFSSSIEMFNMENAQISGLIPRGIGNMSNMLSLALNGNDLTGNVPSEIGRLKKLQRLFLNRNRLQEHLPLELCELNQLGDIILSENQLSGILPDCLGSLSRLQKLMLGSNNFSSSLPLSLWDVKSLLLLNISQNSLQGELPEDIGELESADGVDLSKNKFSGIIPITLGNLRSLRYLSLSNNAFQGSIPSSFENLLSLEVLDLSTNSLTGNIPKSLQNLHQLREINLSYNHLEGEIPSSGVFTNSSPKYFIGNKDLCGNPTLQVPPCTNKTHGPGSLSKNRLVKIVVPVISSVMLIVVLVSFWIIGRRKIVKQTDPAEALQMTTYERISYREIQQATDNFSASNLIGQGSSGSVYKGILSSGVIVAIKILNLEDTESRKRFNAECEVMRQIRHRNLVKVISTCSNEGIWAIVLEYMTNGNLDFLLHGKNYYLDLLKRVNIILDVAMAIEYLHHGYNHPIIHCDLKPANVLLDKDTVAHVSDFGISKILAQNSTSSLTKTLGTIGYIAPEYGLKGIVSTKCDVYSFGIMLLELFTGKKPTEEMFDENVSFREWVKALYPTSVMEIIDRSILQGDGKLNTQQEICIFSVVELALDCSKESPEERPNMKDVLIRLQKIKSALLEEKELPSKG